jgi:hypothetical protein
MKEWTSSADLKAQVLRLWDRDQLIGGEYPLRLTLRGPNSAALSERFDEVRAWVADLQQGSSKGYRLVLRDVRHRVIGSNSLPSEAWVDTQDDALRLTGKLREARAFAELMSVTRQQQPGLIPWLQCQPRRALVVEGFSTKADPREQPFHEALALTQATHGFNRSRPDQAEVAGIAGNWGVRQRIDDAIKRRRRRALQPRLAVTLGTTTEHHLGAGLPARNHCRNQLGRVLPIGVQHHHGGTRRHMVETRG